MARASSPSYAHSVTLVNWSGLVPWTHPPAQLALLFQNTRAQARLPLSQACCAITESQILALGTGSERHSFMLAQATCWGPASQGAHQWCLGHSLSYSLMKGHFGSPSTPDPCTCPCLEVGFGPGRQAGNVMPLLPLCHPSARDFG